MKEKSIMKNKLIIGLIGLFCLQVDLLQATGRTPAELGQDLIEAIRANESEKVQKLITGGADLTVKDSSGKTALHRAILDGDTRATLALIKAGANVNAQDNSNNTPLHEAVLTDNARIVKALIGAGAKIDIKSKSNLTPLEMAQEYENPAVLKAFQAVAK